MPKKLTTNQPEPYAVGTLPSSDAAGIPVASSAVGILPLPDAARIPVASSAVGILPLPDAARIPVVSGDAEGQPGSSSVEGQPGSSSVEGQPGSSPFKGQPGSSPFKGQPSSSPFRGQLGSSPFKGQPGSSPFRGQPSSSPFRGQLGSSPFRGQPGSSSVEGQPRTHIANQEKPNRSLKLIARGVLNTLSATGTVLTGATASASGLASIALTAIAVGPCGAGGGADDCCGSPSRRGNMMPSSDSPFIGPVYSESGDSESQSASKNCELGRQNINRGCGREIC